MEIDDSKNTGMPNEAELAPISKYEEQRVVRDWPGMVIGAAMRWRVESGLSYAQNPEDVEFPSDEWFRKDDSQEFMAAVRKEIKKQMEKAKPHLVQILDQTVRNIHTEVKTSPTVQSVQEKLGKDSFRLARQLNWYVGLLKGRLPDRVTPELLMKIKDVAKNAAHVLNTWMTDEQEVETIENTLRTFADKGIVDDEIWEAVKDLSGQEFVVTLFKKMGVHIGIQPLNSQELDIVFHEDMKTVVKSIIAKLGIPVEGLQSEEVKGQQEDVKGVARFLVGVSGGDVMDKEKLNRRSLSDDRTVQRRRTLGTLRPIVYIAADKGLFPGKSSKEQLELMSDLQLATKGQHFGTLGVVQALDLTQRAAILKPVEVAKNIGATPLRLICQDNLAGGYTFVDVRYDRSDGHAHRKLGRRRDKKLGAEKGVGIAWGEEFLIEEK